MSVAATIIVAALNNGSGFTRRHDDSHHREILETRRVVDQSSGLPPEKKNKFLDTKTECVRMSPFISRKTNCYKSRPEGERVPQKNRELQEHFVVQSPEEIEEKGRRQKGKTRDYAV
jgi:hypothetical protein